MSNSARVVDAHAHMASRLDAGRLFLEHGEYIARQLAKLGAMDIEDEVQEVFLTAHRLGGFDPRTAHPRSWLFSIAINVRRDRRRHARRRPTDLDAESVERAACGAASPEDRASAREQLVWFRRALEALSQEEREVIVLREVDGKSYEEIAALVSVPVGTIHTRLFRGREKLISAYRSWAAGLPRRRGKSFWAPLRIAREAGEVSEDVALSHDPRAPAKLRVDLARSQRAPWANYDVRRGYAVLLLSLGISEAAVAAKAAAWGGLPVTGAASPGATTPGLATGVIPGAIGIAKGLVMGVLLGASVSCAVDFASGKGPTVSLAPSPRDIYSVPWRGQDPESVPQHEQAPSRELPGVDDFVPGVVGAEVTPESPKPALIVRGHRPASSAAPVQWLAAPPEARGEEEAYKRELATMVQIYAQADEDPAGTLAKLEQADREFPQPVFRPERERMRRVIFAKSRSLRPVPVPK